MLPFLNVGGLQEDEYFSDGLAEELLDLLARIDGLQVAARTSAFAFKGKNQDVRSIGDSLGVRTVLEGSVRRDGQRVRVMAQLINVANGYHLWSEKYDVELSSIFEVQERIARSIVDALQIELALGDSLTIKGTAKVQAHDYYLLGLDRFNRRGGGPEVREAIDFFQKAIAEDSSYAKAYAGLALAYAVAPGYTDIPTADGARQARAAAERAIRLDSQAFEPYAALCYSENNNEWRWADAWRSCQAALERNPNSSLVYQWRSQLQILRGQLDSAEASVRKALAVDPLSQTAYRNAVGAALALGNKQLAEQRVREAFRIDPNEWNAGTLFLLLLQWKRNEEVLAFLKANDEAPATIEAFTRAFADQSDPAARSRVVAVGTLHSRSIRAGDRARRLITCLAVGEKGQRFARQRPICELRWGASRC